MSKLASHIALFWSHDNTGYLVKYIDPVQILRFGLDYIWIWLYPRIFNPVLSFASDLIKRALKYRSVTDIVRPIREIVRRGKKTTGHSVRRKWNWGLLFVRPEWIGVRPNCSFVQRKSKCTLAQD
jgi:hypothetical protein